MSELHPTIPLERENRVLAQVAEERVHPARGTPLSLDDARRLVAGLPSSITITPGLNSAIGYVTPKDMLAGRQHEIHAEGDRRLAEARQQRQIRR
jgi:hypothetical protein